MRRVIRAKSCQVLLVLGLGMYSMPAAWSFDTGHHYDLTREALQAEGVGDTAIRVAQVQNALVDYFSNSPVATIEPDVAKLHFDNLFSTGDVRNYWWRLTRATKNAVQQAVRDKDTLKLLTLLGISLHAVQDFYAHSNWVETHPRQAGGAYRTETWFRSPPGVNGPAVYSGAYPKMQPGGVVLHGDYSSGLNHDSYVRPRWDEAYVFAYAASREWARAIKLWAGEINPSFWQSVSNYTAGPNSNALKQEEIAAYRLAEWVRTPKHDGHWKGNHSGSVAEFGKFAVAYAAGSDSVYVQQFKQRNVHRLLSQELFLRDGSPVPPTPAPIDIPSAARSTVDRRVVIIRTLSVKEREVGFFEQKIDPGGQADFYAKITVAGQTFIEAMQLDRASLTPSWTTLKFVHRFGLPLKIRYELWDEDGGLGGDDDHCDINPKENARDLNFSYVLGSHACSGDVKGVHDSAGNAYVSAGAKPDSDRAEIKFFITTQSVIEAPGS